MADRTQLVRVAVEAGVRKEWMKEGKGGNLLIAVKEPAQDGRANARVRELIARQYAVPLKCVRITTGHDRPRKTVAVGIPAPLPTS